MPSVAISVDSCFVGPSLASVDVEKQGENSISIKIVAVSSLGGFMKIVLSCGFAISSCFFSVEAIAQFTAPPVNPPPLCDRLKDFPADGPVGSACEAGSGFANPDADINTVLDCSAHNGVLACNAYVEWFESPQWQALDQSWPLYSWSFIVDGQEYHLQPSPNSSIWVDCGYSRHGYVRVTAEGSTAITSFACSAAREELEAE